MDQESEHAIRVLECIASCNEEFIGLAQWLRSVGHSNVIHGFDCRAYDSGTNIELYVETEIQGGRAICWWLEVSWGQEHWSIEPSVLVNDDDGQKVVKVLSESKPRTGRDFIFELKEATSNLIDDAKSMDLVPVTA